MTPRHFLSPIWWTFAGASTMAMTVAIAKQFDVVLSTAELGWLGVMGLLIGLGADLYGTFRGESA